MWTPTVAVLWESWRLTRSALALFALYAGLSCALLSKSALPGSPAFVMLFFTAVAMAFILPMFGTATGRGFPLSKDFSRPIRTSILVAVPLGYVGVVAAACYLVPAAFLRVLTGESFPLIPFAALIGALAVLVAGSAWFARDALARTGTAIAAYLLAGVMFKLLDPFREAGHFPFKVGPKLCEITAAGYFEIALLIAGIYPPLLWAVERQRHAQDGASAPGSKANESRADSGDILAWIRNTCVELFRWRCPTSSPTAAEVWFELQYYGIAVLAIGALLALSVPLLMLLASSHRSAIPLVFAAATLVAPFMAGAGASIWNRRTSGPVPIGSAKLIGLRVLVTTVCVWAAWSFIATSLWASLPLLKEMYNLESAQALAAQFVRHDGIRWVSAAFVCFILLATLLAFLTAIRSLASSYGWRFRVAASGLLLYASGVSIAVARGFLDRGVIDTHIWALAVAIPVLTICIFAKALASGILTPRQVSVASLIWLVFAVLYLDVLHAFGMMDASPALASASVSLPLLAVALAPWSFSLVRNA